MSRYISFIFPVFFKNVFEVGPSTSGNSVNFTRFWAVESFFCISRRADNPEFERSSFFRKLLGFVAINETIFVGFDSFAKTVTLNNFDAAFKSAIEI